VVLLVDAQKLARQREVLTGYRAEGRVQIRKGLQAGELVVVEGGYGLADGTKVHIQEHQS